MQFHQHTLTTVLASVDPVTSPAIGVGLGSGMSGATVTRLSGVITI